MSFIDWSDPEEMVGLLLDFVKDELSDDADPERARFLRRLAADIESVAANAPGSSLQATMDGLRDIHDSQPSWFIGDPVLVHVHDCIQELERIIEQSDA